jgi:hypothetical protein
MKQLFRMIILAAVLFPSLGFSVPLRFITLSNEIHAIEYGKDEKITLAGIKGKLIEKLGLSSGDRDQIDILYNGILLTEDNLATVKLFEVSALQLMIKANALAKMKYPPQYSKVIGNAESVFSQLVPFNEIIKLAHEDFCYQAQLYTFQLESLFKYNLPGDFFVDIAEKLKTKFPNMDFDLDITNREALSTLAQEYLKSGQADLSTMLTKWKNDPKLMATYMRQRIAYAITLAKMLGDEYINVVEDRFFTAEQHRQFDDSYNNINRTRPLEDMRNKYRDAHHPQRF